MKEKISKLIDVKSIMTLIMTIALILMLFIPVNPPKEILALYCTSYGAIITYFYTKKSATVSNT